jgi:cobaltochelatase CobT
MRGHPITVTALTADILTRALERCGIKVELLGYTTADGDGGAPAKEWQAAGSPADPGRLGALRHILYKEMDTPWRRSRRDLGLMLKEGLLQQNIDGEALGWACQRLLLRPEPRRILIVISDGAPVDNATLSANSRNYLDQHLHQVVAWVESKTDVELYAIGIGHQVGRYYTKSINLLNVDELGTSLLKRLREWLDG